MSSKTLTSSLFRFWIVFMRMKASPSVFIKVKKNNLFFFCNNFVICLFKSFCNFVYVQQIMKSVSALHTEHSLVF